MQVFCKAQQELTLRSNYLLLRTGRQCRANAAVIVARRRTTR